MADNSTFGYSAGLQNVGSYMVSGDPYISGSDSQAVNTEVEYGFQWVASKVTIHNYSNRVLRVHYNSLTASGDVAGGLTSGYGGLHYLEVQSITGSAGGVLELGAKCTGIYVSVPNDGGGKGHYRVYAELTGIPAARMYDLTGSGLTEAPAGSDA
tara:strand:- start:1012 stop:1476 length:465 start_codon:yes stop_codon:yes gene_type:complete